jgi:uncharacterized protein
VAKFLLVIAVFIVVYLFLRAYRRRVETAPPPAAAKQEEDMVRCQICGVHLPKSEAVTSRGEFYCSKEHLQLSDQARGR